MQKVLEMTTEKGNIRSEAIGWTANDGDLVTRQYGPVGEFRSLQGYHSYRTPLHALGDGWKLLAPPSRLEEGTWEWWFVKD